MALLEQYELQFIDPYLFSNQPNEEPSPHMGMVLLVWRKSVVWARDDSQAKQY